ncbi:unnamed protein product [Effrenium voratum]|uniref:Uncharacterized protein n=1 Tax=Effrenium voratum TaxID=2562239 RepID=A0AA36JCE7_9DINO|nr:unnamed protein product [Effrenium voratum]
MGSSPSCCERSGPLEAPAEIVAPTAAEKEPGPDAQETLDGESAWSSDLELQCDHLKVDSELLRGISLAKTLGALGRLWHKSPVELLPGEREGLWLHSAKVESFDLFLSHTWRTWGGWKVLALSFHFGWKWMLLLWLLAMVTSGLLSAAGLLPAVFSYGSAAILSYEADSHFFPWVSLSIACAMLASFVALPYLLALSPATMCFFDVVSIHQTDDNMMKRGIYGLGGFLSVAQELHVLWSPPYLSRMWCIFELAAYRKANPSGQIVMHPLFTAIVTASWMMGAAVAAGIYSCLLPFSEGALTFVVGLAALGVFPSVHATRKHMREKHALISQLKNFDVHSTDCRLEKDREFIFSAIQSWYGSLDAFNEHVRGPLREELLKDSKTELPLSYAFLICSVPSGISLDLALSLLSAGAPAQVILCQLCVSITMHVFGTAFALNIIWRLCARFAAARSSKGLDYAVTVLIFGVFILSSVLGLMITRFARERSLIAAIACCLNSLLCMLVAYGKCRCRRPASM